MKKALKIFISVFAAAGLLYIAWLNWNIHYAPHFETEQGMTYNRDLLEQLRFIETQIHGSAGDEMQEIYPEGYFFTHVLYGLSWCELARPLKTGTPLFREAQREITWAISRLDLPKARSIFDASGEIPYGVFYRGWMIYLQGSYLALLSPENRPPELLERYEFTCDRIAGYLLTHENPYPESYPGQAWPSDVTVAAAALARHDRFLAKKYAPALQYWLAQVKKHLGPEGLIPHKVDAVTGKSIQDARGSSQSLILNFLQEIDPVFARQQFTLYKNHFLASRFGLPGIREYRGGTSGFGDADSGPVLLGIGGSASVVGLRTMSLYGEQVTAAGLRNSIEAFGMAYSSGSKKKYLFGMLPVADVFIAWANSTEYDRSHALMSGGPSFAFHLWSLFFAAPLFLLIQRCRRRWPWKKKTAAS